MDQFSPAWNGAIEGYAKNQIKKDGWRFTALGYDYEDLEHECFLIFLRCRNKYQGSVTNPAHFMSLFKMALRNHFNDLSVESKEIGDFFDDSCDLFDMPIEVPEKEISTLYVLMKNAPVEVKQVMSLIFNAPSELLEMVGFFDKHTKGFLNNQKLCALLGYDPQKINLVKMVKDHFTV